jgi:hypothetical protein
MAAFRKVQRLRNIIKYGGYQLFKQITAKLKWSGKIDKKIAFIASRV